MKIEPFVVTADDYHEFDDVISHFNCANIKLKFKEVGFGQSSYCLHNQYHAVFYQNLKDAKSLVNKLTKTLFQEEGSADWN